LCEGEILLEQWANVIEIRRDESVCRSEVRCECERQVACSGADFQNGASAWNRAGFGGSVEGTRRVKQGGGERLGRRRGEVGAKEIGGFPGPV
jgi:hypothetical protein